MARIEWGLNPEIIKTIYISVIEPIVMYAACVWAPELKKKKIRKKLDALQRGFAQKIAKTYRTVSLNAALVLAGLMPLDLKIQEAAQTFLAKHHNYSPLCPDKILEAKADLDSIPHPGAQIDIEYSSQNEDQSHHTNTYPSHIIFTDGSKIDQGVGAAISYWRDGAEVGFQKLYLESHCTVFQAELLALSKAAEFAQENGFKETAVISDSKSALEVIRDPNTHHPLGVATRKSVARIRESGNIIQLFWTRAHVGTVGNERADELAKEAAGELNAEVHYEMYPLSYLKRLQRNNSKLEWAARYSGAQSGQTTKLFLPDTDLAFKLIKNRRFAPEMVQALTGHGGFAAYLHRFGLRNDPWSVCDDVEETSLHIILDCPRFESSRQDLIHKINTELDNESLGKLISNEKTRPCLEEFCINIVRKCRLRHRNT